MSKKKHNNKTDKKKHHIFGNNRLNEMFCDSRETFIDFYRMSVESFDEWFDTPRLKAIYIGERENKIVSFMVGLMETAFELGWNEAMKKMKTPSNSPSMGRTQSPMKIEGPSQPPQGEETESNE